MRYSRSVAVSPRAIADGDPLYGEQWAWKKMEAESAWGRLRDNRQYAIQTSKGAVVAV